MLPHWDNNFSVHNAHIDHQHKRLFELAAEVEKIWDRPVSRDKVKELLADFFHYMKDHFSDEEKYMEMIGFPELNAHKKIHKEIIQMMIDLIKNIKSTNDLKEKLYMVTKKWLLEHILFEDMKVAKYRESLLDSKDSDETSFVANSDEDEQEEKKSYLYSCGCKGKVHDVPYNIHNKIQNKGKSFHCKICQQDIVFNKTI